MQTNPEFSETDRPVEMFEAILSGNYQEYLNINDFNTFLAEFLFEESSCKSSRQSQSFDPNCLFHHGKPIIARKLLEHLIEKDSLKHIWNFCREFIVSIDHSNSENIVQKLLKFQSDFSSLYASKISDKNYIFTENDSNTIDSYYAFIKEFFQIPDFMKESITYFSGQDAFGHSKVLLKRIISYAPNQTQAPGNQNSTPRYSYDIIPPLKNFTIGLGKLALQLRNNEDVYDFTEDSASELIDIATSKLKPVELSSIRYAFVNQYHYGYDDIEETCQRVFNTNECYPYDSTVDQVFQSIAQANHLTHTINSSEILKQLLFGTSKSIIERLKTLNTTKDKNNPLCNFLDYFKQEISYANQQNKELTTQYVENLSRLLIRLSDLFKEMNPKPKLLNKSLSLFLTLLKNSSIKQHDMHLWPALNACADQVKALISYYKDYSASHNNDITTSLRIFSAILHSTNNIDEIINGYNQQINAMVFDFSRGCFEINACDSFTVLNQFSKNLGTMARRLYKNGEFKAANSTISNEQTIIKSAAYNNISIDQLQGLAWTFLNQYHDSNTGKIAIDCEKLFNFTDCKNIVTNVSTEIESDIIFTTIIPDTTTNRITNTPVTTTTAATTVPRVIPLHLNETTIPVNTTETSITTTALPVNVTNNPSFNQTAADSVNEKNTEVSLSNPELTLGASAAHGVGSGMLNGIIQHFATRASGQGEPSSKAKAIALYTSLFAHAAFTATFPLMLFKIQEYINQGNEDEAQQLWDNLLYQALPTFLISAASSLGLQIGYQAINEFRKTCFNRFFSAVTKNTLPFAGVAYNFYYNPLPTAVHFCASSASSSLTYGLLNRFFPAKNQQSLDIEAIKNTKVKYDVPKNAVEMQPLQSHTDRQNQVEKRVTSNNSKPLIYFMTQTNLDQMRNNLALLCLHSAGACSIYENYIEFLNRTEEKLPSNKKPLLDTSSYDANFKLLKKNLEDIKIDQASLGIREVSDFEGIAYKHALKTTLEKNGTSDENIEEYLGPLSINKLKINHLKINGLETKHLEISDETINYLKYLEMPTHEKTYATNEAYPQHNLACKGFSIESDLVKDQSIIKLLTLMKRIKEVIKTFEGNLLKIEGIDIASLPNGTFYEISHIKDYIGFIQTEINETIKRYDNYNQAAVIQNKNASNTNKDFMRSKNGSVSIKDNRRVTFHAGDSDGSPRTSTGDESTSSGISIGGSDLDSAEHQEHRPLVKLV